MAIADVRMTSRSLTKNSKADLPSGTTSVMTTTGYSGRERFKSVLLEWFLLEKKRNGNSQIHHLLNPADTQNFFESPKSF